MYDEIISHIGSREPTAMRRDSGVIDDSSYPEAGKSTYSTGPVVATMLPSPTVVSTAPTPCMCGPYPEQYQFLIEMSGNRLEMSGVELVG